MTSVYYREVIDVILSLSEDWARDEIFSSKTLPLLVQKMPGKI